MYCMYTILQLRWKPKEFASMSRKEKAFVIACIDEKIKAEKEERDKLKRN